MKPTARFFLLLLPLLLTGCFFEKPLTATPSEAVNTWFLGEWQHKEKDGGVSRAVVTPAGHDFYRIQVTLAGKLGGVYDFEGWASRVGNSTFLTLQNLHQTSKLPDKSFVFIHPQMMDQNRIRIRGLELESAQNAESIDLRKEVRARLAEGTLYSEEKSQDWVRVAEVYRDRDGKTGLFTPLRYEVPTHSSNH